MSDPSGMKTVSEGPPTRGDAAEGSTRRGASNVAVDQATQRADGKKSALPVRNALSSLPDYALQAGPAAMLVLLIIVASILSPYFATAGNLGNVMSQVSVLAVLAMGQLLVILTGGIDLSVGSALSLATVCGALTYEHTHSTVLTIGALLGTGLVVGLINGVVFVKGRLPHSFINTLAMLGVASGVALLLSNGEPIIGMPTAVTNLGSYVGQIPVSIFVVIAIAALCWILTRVVVWGRWIYAVGANRDAAQRVGIPVNRVLISVYALSGLAAGFAAAIAAGQTAGGSATVGQNMELDAIAAVIIGGASLLGGRGTVLQVLIGAFTIAIIHNMLNILNVSAYYQYIAVGAVLVLAVEGDVLRRSIENRRRAAEGLRQEEES